MNHLLKSSFEKHASKILFRLPCGKSRTYEEIWNQSGLQAFAWKKYDLEGKKVLLQHPNSERWLVEALATWRLGGQVVSVSTQEQEFEKKKEWAKPALVSSFRQYRMYKSSSADPSNTNSPLCLFTSGSLGSGKPIVFSEDNLVSQMDQLNQVVCEDMVCSDDVSIAMLPWSHSYGLMCELLFSITRGSSLYLPTKEEHIFLQFQRVKPTLLFTVPYFLEKIVRFPGWMRDLQKQIILGGKLRSVSVGGAPCDPRLLQEFETSMGVKVYQGYGMTEASPMISLNTRDKNKIGTAGKLLPGMSVEFSDDGELYVKGPNVVQSLPEERYIEKNGEKYLKTGDKGWFDKDGFLVIGERIADHFKLSNGYFVNASLLEEIFHKEFAKKFKIEKIVVLQEKNNLHLVVFHNSFYPPYLHPWIKQLNEKFVELPDWFFPCRKLIGKKYDLKEFEIPRRVFWVKSNHLTSFQTQKFTIRRHLLQQEIQPFLKNRF